MKTKLLFITICLTFLASSSLGEKTLKKDESYEGDLGIQVIRKITLPKGYHEGLYLDGGNIWVCNGKKINTWVIDTSNGKVSSKIIPVAGFTEGITQVGEGDFWVTDWDDKKLYRVKIKENKMVAERAVSLEPAYPAGVIWTGEELYVITWTRGIGTKYGLLRMNKEGELLDEIRIKRIHEPAHLAWDGKYLWITSWYNQKVYKISTEDFKILGSFDSPAKDTTGIVWDGEGFWITGTHDDLYKVKLK